MRERRLRPRGRVDSLAHRGVGPMTPLDAAILRLRQARRLYRELSAQGNRSAASKLVHECVDDLLRVYDESMADPYGGF